MHLKTAEPSLLPSWVNENLLESVLRKSEKDSSIRVVKILAKPATAKGDNYTSNILRVAVDFKKKKGSQEIEGKRSLIVKIANDSSDMDKELVEQVGVVDQEIKMMSSTLIAMEDILGDTKFCGRYFYGQEDPPAVMMEDLTELEFKLTDRRAGLDLPHSLIAIRNLAKFHASSVAIVEKDPSLTQFYNKGMFFDCGKTNNIQQFINSAMKSVSLSLAESPETKVIGKKLLLIAENAYDFFTKRLAFDEKEFNVINHGDCWVNNMLFHYDSENQVDGQIFVDFQVSVYKSPAVDLQYFVNSSLSEDMYENHKGELVKEYLKVLTATMERIGCKTAPPTADELDKTLRKYELYGLFAACVCLPIMTTQEKDVKSLDEMVDEDGTFGNKQMSSPEFLERIRKRLVVWDEMGILDV